MQKVLFYIVAGENDRGRAIMGLTVARRSFEYKRFADVKVILQGPSEKLLLDEDEEVQKVVNYLISNKLIDSACTFYAKKMEIEASLEKIGVELKPSGERLSSYINEGYVPLTF